MALPEWRVVFYMRYSTRMGHGLVKYDNKSSVCTYLSTTALVGAGVEGFVPRDE